MPLYPFLFRPKYVPKIWGGQRLRTVLNKPVPWGEPIGESWELYDFPPGVVGKGVDKGSDTSTVWVSAQVANGPLAGRTLRNLIEGYGRELLGDLQLLPPHGQFPILVKFLDAGDDLSVQVHPNERYAAAHPDCHLKNESWYVMEHDAGAAIYKGLVPGTTREQFRAAIESGHVMDRIVRIPVNRGDCHYLPSGTLHALGAGVLVAEVQTPSDTTFRVFDFDRIEEATGKPRKLHVEEAMACIDFDGADHSSPPRTHDLRRLVTCQQFEVHKAQMPAGDERRLDRGQPVVWIMLAGEAHLRTADVADPTIARKGDTVLLPAHMADARATAVADCTWLEVAFPATR